MTEVLLWYLISLLVGWLVFPLAYRLLSRLPDRGLAFLRPFGLLAWGFLFWLLSSLRVLGNTPGEILFALALVAALSAWTGRGHWSEMRTWVRSKLGLILSYETLFLAAMVFMALMRAAAPDTTGTEKPMELAFINAILRSPGMPPADPWLAGYAISYYYFGYLMTAMLAQVSGVAGGVAFNLAIALWFAMTAAGAYGLLFNLLEHKSGESQRVTRFGGARVWALLGPLFILVISNLGGLMEILHANGTFWSRGQDGVLTSPFWQNLKIQEWEQPPAEPFELTIKRSGWWWWRSSRVLRDFKLNGDGVEVIDEFPQFSYLLADLHPHVLAVPFVLLALGWIFNFYVSGLKSSALNIGGVSPPPFDLLKWLRTPGYWGSAVIIGALGFLNVWDFPIYLVVFGMVFALVRYHQIGWKFFRLLKDFLGFILALGVGGVLLYLPFYLGFSSQAGPPYFYLSLAFFTPGANFWIMFATLLIPLFAWLIWMGLRNRVFIGENREMLWRGIAFSAILVFGLWLLSYLIGVLLVVILSSATDLSVSGQNVGDWFYYQQGSTDGFAILGQSLLRRFAQPGTWLTLFVLLALGWAGLGALRKASSVENTDTETDLPDKRNGHASGFVLVLALAGAGLTLFPEFFFLKDDFGARMNTIFKFYYQTWILWGIAAAFGIATMMRNLRWIWKIGFGVIVAALVAVGMIYAYFGFVDRMGLRDSTSQNDFKLWGLDGTAYVKTYNPKEWEAIDFLNRAEYGFVLEAVGNQYSQYARIGTLTGLPSVLGWPGHEGQWRGTRVNFAPRIDQVKLVYESPDWDSAKAVLDMYNVRYIFIGDLERSTYLVREDKFSGKVAPVFANDSVIIYEYLP